MYGLVRNENTIKRLIKGNVNITEVSFLGDDMSYGLIQIDENGNRELMRGLYLSDIPEWDDNTEKWKATRPPARSYAAITSFGSYVLSNLGFQSIIGDFTW